MSSTEASAKGSSDRSTKSKPAGGVLGPVRRHPVVAYFILTFLISWGGFALVAPGGIPADPPQGNLEAFIAAVMVMLLGPSVASLLLTGLTSGRPGFRELLARLFKWRVGVRWYAAALLAAPLLYSAAVFPLSLISTEFLPGIFTAEDKVALVLMGLGVGLLGGFLEELGWTGFAIPRLRLRFGVLATGLTVGLLWAAWHFLSNWHDDSFSSPLPLAILLVSVFAWLPPFRVLMVWVYDKTESVLIAVLMHASLIASTLFILAPTATGSDQLTYVLVWTAVLWVAVGVLALALRGRSARQPAADVPTAGATTPAATDHAA